MVSKVQDCPSSEAVFSTKGAPASIDKNIIRGISGGKVIWEAMNVRSLFSRKQADREMARNEWKPQNGENPIKTPRATDFAFVLLLPPVSRMFSFKKRFHPFRLKYRQNIFWLLMVFWINFFNFNRTVYTNIQVFRNLIDQ